MSKSDRAREREATDRWWRRTFHATEEERAKLRARRELRAARAAVRAPARKRTAAALATALLFLDVALTERFDARFPVATEAELDAARAMVWRALTRMRRTAR